MNIKIERLEILAERLAQANQLYKRDDKTFDMYIDTINRMYRLKLDVPRFYIDQVVIYMAQFGDKVK